MCSNLSWEKPSLKLPDPRQRVIVVVKTKYGGNKWSTIAEHVPKHTVLAEDFLDHDCDPDFCDVGEDGQEYAPEGWYESPIEPDVSFLIDGEVLYWMKMPAVPIT